MFAIVIPIPACCAWRRMLGTWRACRPACRMVRAPGRAAAQHAIVIVTCAHSQGVWLRVVVRVPGAADPMDTASESPARGCSEPPEKATVQLVLSNTNTPLLGTGCNVVVDDGVAAKDAASHGECLNVEHAR